MSGYTVWRDGDQIKKFRDGTRTWEWYPGIPREDRILRIDAHGRDLEDFCIEHGLNLEPYLARIRAQIKASLSVGYDLPTEAMFSGVFRDYHMAVSDFLGSVALEPSPEYEMRRDLYRVLHGINETPVLYGGRKKYFNFTQWGTVTGRFSESNFGILHMKKESRHLLTPHGACFVEFDFNAADVRTFLLLAGLSQPKGDVHEWLAREFFSGGSRDDVKREFFAWFYGDSGEGGRLNKVFARDDVLARHVTPDGIKLTTGRVMRKPEESRKYLPWLVQAETAILFCKKVVAVEKALSDFRSHLAFGIHDSLVVDVAEGEVDGVIDAVLTVMESEGYMINVTQGENYGEMKCCL